MLADSAVCGTALFSTVVHFIAVRAATCEGRAPDRIGRRSIIGRSMKNIVILISGAGTNMAAIAKAAEQERWDRRFDARIAAVISNRADAAGLELARGLGIATAVVPHREYPTREDFDRALATAIEAHAPALIVLAGFMRILTPGFIERFRGRMLNVHPSLLPAFPGLDTHRRAIEAGCKVAGLTVHEVTADLDHGPILAQAVVPILAGDTPETLARRVLAHEHRVYPRAIASRLGETG